MTTANASAIVPSNRRRRWRARTASVAAAAALLTGAMSMASGVGAATRNPTIPPLRGAQPPGKAASPAGKANTANSIGGLDFPSSVPSTGSAAPTGTVKDDFSTGSDWQLYADDTSIVGLSAYKDNPVLLFSEVGEQTLLSYPKSRVPANADAQFSVSLTRSTEEYSVGAFCRGRGKNRYEFMVGSTGAYALFRIDDGKATNILPGGKWVASSSIPKGFTNINVGISCRGDQLSLLVAGQKVATVRDSTYTVGNIGPVVSNFVDGAELRAVIDDLTLTM